MVDGAIIRLQLPQGLEHRQRLVIFFLASRAVANCAFSAGSLGSRRNALLSSGSASEYFFCLIISWAKPPVAAAASLAEGAGWPRAVAGTPSAPVPCRHWLRNLSGQQQVGGGLGAEL